MSASQAFWTILEDLYAQVDEGDSGQWTAFLHAWLATYGERLMAVAELTDDLLSRAVPCVTCCRMTWRMRCLHGTVRPDASAASWGMRSASASSVALVRRTSFSRGARIGIRKSPCGGSDVAGDAGRRGEVASLCPRRLSSHWYR